MFKDRKKKMKTTYLCGGCNKVHTDEDFDPKVDKELQIEEKFRCGHCKAEIVFGVKFCSNCGHPQLWGLFG